MQGVGRSRSRAQPVATARVLQHHVARARCRAISRANSAWFCFPIETACLLLEAIPWKDSGPLWLVWETARLQQPQSAAACRSLYSVVAPTIRFPKWQFGVGGVGWGRSSSSRRSLRLSSCKGKRLGWAPSRSPPCSARLPFSSIAGEIGSAAARCTIAECCNPIRGERGRRSCPLGPKGFPAAPRIVPFSHPKQGAELGGSRSRRGPLPCPGISPSAAALCLCPKPRRDGRGFPPAVSMEPAEEASMSLPRPSGISQVRQQQPPQNGSGREIPALPIVCLWGRGERKCGELRHVSLCF